MPTLKSRPARLSSVALLLVVLLVLVAGPVRADDPADPPAASASAGQQLPAGELESSDPSSESGLRLGNRSLLLLAGLGTAALVSKSFEDPDYMARRLDGLHLDALIDLGDRCGDGLPLGVGTAGLLVTGHLLGNRNMTVVGSDMARSLLWSGMVVWALKIAVDAERPDGGRYSFPSGHTASAFSAAPVVARHWGWRAGLGAFTLATATALGRMEDRRHYLADVLFGAAIGLAIGYEVSREPGGGEGGGGGPLGGILNAISATSQGVGLSIRF